MNPPNSKTYQNHPANPAHSPEQNPIDSLFQNHQNTTAEYFHFINERFHYCRFYSNSSERNSGVSAGLEGFNYRYHFNNKETDNEVIGEGNQVDYGFRVYDPRIARFLSIDPLANRYPWYTPYQFAGDNSIRYIDIDGLEQYDPMSDPDLLAKLIKTSFFDIKHSFENIGLNVFYPPGDPGKRWVATYAVNGNGDEIFETVFLLVPKKGVLNEALSYSLDFLTVACSFSGTNTAGLNSPATLALKTSFSNQYLKPIREVAKTWTGIKALRFKVAEEFIKKSGVLNLEGHLSAINFDKMVLRTFVNKGTYLYQWVDKSKLKDGLQAADLGDYFFSSLADVQKLGLDIKDRVLVRVKVTSQTEALQSTCRDFNNQLGGATQFFSTSIKKFVDNLTIILK